MLNTQCSAEESWRLSDEAWEDFFVAHTGQPLPLLTRQSLREKEKKRRFFDVWWVSRRLLQENMDEAPPMTTTTERGGSRKMQKMMERWWWFCYFSLPFCCSSLALALPRPKLNIFFFSGRAELEYKSRETTSTYFLTHSSIHKVFFARCSALEMCLISTRFRLLLLSSARLFFFLRDVLMPCYNSAVFFFSLALLCVVCAVLFSSFGKRFATYAWLYRDLYTSSSVLY